MISQHDNNNSQYLPLAQQQKQTRISTSCDAEIEADQSVPLSPASMVTQPLNETDNNHTIVATNDENYNYSTGGVSMVRPLQLLFSLNGLTLSLQSLPLMYIVNTRVALPLAYLPTYGALAFLPWSLKPLYAILSTQNEKLPRHVLIVYLLIASGIASISTSLFIHPGGIISCFILAFMRGIADSWAEFCLGLSLIDQARKTQRYQQQRARLNIDESTRNHCATSYENMAALFQSQAATARNLGSLLGGVITCLLFVHNYFYSNSGTDLTDSVANGLLIFTGLLLFAGSLVAWKNQDTFQELATTDGLNTNTTTFNNQITDEESPLNIQQHRSYTPSYCEKCCPSVADSESSEGHESSSGLCQFQSNILLVSLLQLSIVALSLKDLIVDWASHFVWKVILISLLSALVLTGIASSFPIWKERAATDSQVQRTGLFLILRHAIPSSSILLGSFMYSILSSRPLYLQLISLIGMGVTTLSSWSYGALFSRYSHGHQLQIVIVGTTLFAGLMSLCHIMLVHRVQREAPEGSDVDGHDHELQTVSLLTVAMALIIKVGTTFASEWEFLPDIVIATTSISKEVQYSRVSTADDVVHQRVTAYDDDSNEVEDRRQPFQIEISPTERQSVDTTAIQYGSLVACIDFGDQLGSLLAGPIVAILGISRENNWLNLDILILICAACKLLPLAFLKLLKS